MSQGIALEGMRLVKEYLPRAYADGADIEARAHMMSAAAMGATAFQKGLGAIHALSHPIGAVHNTHHGTTNAVCMPAVLQFNAPAIADRFDAPPPISGSRAVSRGNRMQSSCAAIQRSSLPVSPEAAIAAMRCGRGLGHSRGTFLRANGAARRSP
jgi:alcohol dehydrogenase class IV